MRRHWMIPHWSILLLLAAGLVLPGAEAQSRKFYGGLPDRRSPEAQYSRALRQGDLAAVIKFLNEGMSPNDSIYPLVLAVRGGHLAMVNLLLTEGADPNMPAAGGLTPLRVAAEKGDLAIVQVLLANGADVNANNPLREAAWQGHLPVVQALLAKGADVNAKDGQGLTAYMRAEEQGHDRICQVLKQAGAQVDTEYSVAGFLRAAAAGDVARIKDFLARGMSPNAKDNWNTTALMRAAEKGRLQVVQILLAKGAEVNAKDKFWSATALGLAKRNKHAEVVKALEQAGAK
jgi:ankyrin repeat protein